MVARQRETVLHFPSGGLNKRFAHQIQPPYTTPSCLNVRADDSLQDRSRGGSRKGLLRMFPQQLGSGNPIRTLNSITIAPDDLFDFQESFFSGDQIPDTWTDASWLQGGLQILPEDLTTLNYTDYQIGGVHDMVSNLDTSKYYVLEIWIDPWLEKFDGHYSIFARMNNTTPNVTQDGIEARLVLTANGDPTTSGTGYYSGTLTSYVSGTPTAYAFSTGNLNKVTAGWFQVEINGDNIKCYWQGNLLVNQNVSSHTGTRYGFGHQATVAGGLCIVDSFRAQYFKTSGETERRTLLVGVSNGEVWRETNYGKIEQSSSVKRLNTTEPIEGVAYLQKIYYADYGPEKYQADDGTINGVDLTSATISDFSNININNDVVEITNATGTVSNQVIGISNVVGGTITLASNLGNGSCSFRIGAGLKVYDPKTDTLDHWIATDGLLPMRAKLVSRYSDRVVLAKDHEWYMTRQGDPLDIDVTIDAEDLSRPVVGSSTDAGLVADLITALIPNGDDYIVFGCRTSIYILHGDPAAGGESIKLSERIGVLGARTWCHGPDKDTFLLTTDGLYHLAAGGRSLAQSVSREVIPQELLKIKNSNRVSMIYDDNERGVHIFLTPETATSESKHWFYDNVTKGFFPDKYNKVHEPFSIVDHSSESGRNKTIVYGCRDGYLRYPGGVNGDDGLDMESYVVLGPFMLGGSQYIDGYLDEIVTTLAENNTSVTWDLYVGDTAEKLLQTTPLVSGTWSSGLNISERPRARGTWAAIKLRVTGDSAWAMESIILVRHPGSKSR